MRTIQVRPSRLPRWQKMRGWEVFEADGVSPVFCGENGREDALSYARQRAGYARRWLERCSDDSAGDGARSGLKADSDRRFGPQVLLSLHPLHLTELNELLLRKIHPVAGSPNRPAANSYGLRITVGNP